MIPARTAVPLTLILLGGCLASKGDIRLLQDEIRATRAQIAVADTARGRSDEARRAQISALATSVERISDSLRSLNGRFSAFQANAAGQFDAVGQQIVQIQALLGQTTRGMAEARAQLEALREQGIPSSSAPAGADTSKGAPAGPGPATLYTSADQALKQGSYQTARNGFDELIRTYPDYPQVPQAQIYVGDSFKAQGNTAAADSVYQLVTTRYPKSSQAATGLYKHGLILWDANKRPEARIVFNRVIKDYPNSPEADLANDRLRPRE